MDSCSDLLVIGLAFGAAMLTIGICIGCVFWIILERRQAGRVGG